MIELQAAVTKINSTVKLQSLKKCLNFTVAFEKCLNSTVAFEKCRNFTLAFEKCLIFTVASKMCQQYRRIDLRTPEFCSKVDSFKITIRFPVPDNGHPLGFSMCIQE